MADALTVRNVSKSFGKLRAVADISFTVHEGEVYGIAGPNGAGKTTLFNTVAGVPYHANTGEILLFGERIDRLSGHTICRRGLARTFQSESVFDTLTVLENVAVGAVFGHSRDRRASAASVHERAVAALEFAGYRGDLSSGVGGLCLFDRKRVMLASALVTEPRVVLLDEPASGLNQAEVDETAALIQSLKGRGITVVLIEHVLPLLLSVSERVMIMNEGAKLTEGPPDVVQQDQRVVEAYLGERHDHAAIA